MGSTQKRARKFFTEERQKAARRVQVVNEITTLEEQDAQFESQIANLVNAREGIAARLEELDKELESLPEPEAPVTDPAAPPA